MRDLSQFDREVMATLLWHAARNEKLRPRLVQAIKDSFYPNVSPRTSEIVAAIERIEASWHSEHGQSAMTIRQPTQSGDE